jgi:uncharacterized membrane protein
MNAALIAPPTRIFFRLFMYAGSVFLCAPVISYCFGRFFQIPVLYSIPLNFVLLVGLSYWFGLWRHEASAAIKIGSVLWAAVAAWFGPFEFIVSFCLVGTLFHISNSCVFG